MSLNNLYNKEPEIIEFLKSNNHKVNKIEYLASGYYADVYNVDNKFVLKFSRNEDDDYNWKKLIGKNFKHVAKCLAVYNKRTMNPILKHKLFDLEDRNRSLIIQRYYPKDINDILSEGTVGVVRFIFREFVDNIVRWKHFEFEKALTYGIGDYKNKFEPTQYQLYIKMMNQLYIGVKELMAHGLSPTDLHSENVRFDKSGNLKIVDF
jgi:serine/threonine protein kinase